MMTPSSPILAYSVPVLQFIAFLLLLLATVSTPVTKSIYLFQLGASLSSGRFRTGVNGSIRFGVWGYCLSAIQVSVAGFTHLTEPTCSEKKLGYTFDSTISNALKADKIEKVISRTTTAALVLHPIATALTFLTLLLTLFTLFNTRGLTESKQSDSRSRILSRITISISAFAAFFTTVIFLIDVILVAVIRKNVNKLSDETLTVTYGNLVWMVLGATIALLFSLIAPCTVKTLRNRIRSRKPETY